MRFHYLSRRFPSAESVYASMVDAFPYPVMPDGIRNLFPAFDENTPEGAEVLARLNANWSGHAEDCE